jgi:hypothetical protein
MRFVDKFLSKDRQIDDSTVAVARQRPANNNGMVFSAPSAKQQLNNNRGTMFLCGPCRDVVRGLVYYAKERIFNNMLYV